MLVETGRVVAVEDGGLWVETIQRSTCSSCSARKGCGQHLLAKAAELPANHIRVLAEPEQHYQVDDWVRIGIPEGVVVQGALLVYMLPLFGLVLGVIAGGQLASWFNWPLDLLAILVGLSGFAAGALGVRYHSFLNRDNREYQPVLLGLAHTTPAWAGVRLHEN